MRRQTRLFAFTLVECLVVVGIVAVLAALVLSAVQQARESARRMTCGHRLRQLGTALAAYHADFGSFPTGIPGTTALEGRLGAFGHLAPHTRLLPYLDEHATYEQINFDFGWDVHPFDFAPVNTSAYRVAIATFLCPSDPQPLRIPGPNNYRCSTGADPLEVELPRGGGGGVFPAFRWIAARQITDGLSQTAAMSERVRGDHDATRFSPGDYWYRPTSLDVFTPDEALAECQRVAALQPAHESTAGITWFHATAHCTLYYHSGPPNFYAQCSTTARDEYSHSGRRGAITASSQHGAGVHLLLADGAVRFIDDAIDLAIWRALATRAGGEPVPSF